LATIYLEASSFQNIIDLNRFPHIDVWTVLLPNQRQEETGL